MADYGSMKKTTSGQRNNDWRLSRKRGRFEVLQGMGRGHAEAWDVHDRVASAISTHIDESELAMLAEMTEETKRSFIENRWYQGGETGAVISWRTKAEALDYATYLRRLVRSGVPVDLTRAP